MNGSTRRDLAARIRVVSHLTSTFRLRSGAESTEYFDKYRFEADPVLLKDICTAMLPLIPANAAALAGLELGGVPIATVLGQLSGLPVLFVRKTAKTYGTCQLAEGGIVQGRHLLIVEDVVSSGGQVIQSAQDLRRLGPTVDDAICVIDRRSSGRATLGASGIHLRPLFTADDLVAAPS